MADMQNEPAPPVEAAVTEAERRSVRHTLALIGAALADCPQDSAPASTEDGEA